MKLGIIFGGKSTEHDISIKSFNSIFEHLNKDKYDIYSIYISKDGKFYECLNGNFNNLKLIDNITIYLKKLDVIFPVLHGIYGEDGTIEGMFEILDIPYVGCGVLSSSLCMNKIYTKTILKMANIEQTNSLYLKKLDNNYLLLDNNFNSLELNFDNIFDKVFSKLKFPVFIKPANGGSSIGVYKANNKEEFNEYLKDAINYDKNIVIEEEIIGREVECAILGNEEIKVSTVGEIITKDTFYTYESKYENNDSFVKIPAELDDELIKSIQTLAKKAYLACACQGLARIDFFIENSTKKVLINEINTMPGFTEISMYPKLFEYEGISYSDLLDKLIELALKNK